MSRKYTADGFIRYREADRTVRCRKRGFYNIGHRRPEGRERVGKKLNYVGLGLREREIERDIERDTKREKER